MDLAEARERLTALEKRIELLGRHL